MLGLPEGGVVPDVEASDRSGLKSANVADWLLLGRVPDVEGMGEECGELEEEEPLELGYEGGCCTCCGCFWAGIGASAGASASAAGAVVVRPSA